MENNLSGLEKKLVTMKEKQAAGSIVLTSIIITLAVSVIGLVFNMINPNGITLVNSSSPPLVEIAEAKQDKVREGSSGDVPAAREIEVITLLEAKAFFERGEGFFVDARSEYKYYELHISGALSLSASKFDSRYEDFSDVIAKDALLIIYCHSITCPYSDIVARKLRGLGYTNIKVFAGGWVEWLQARYPVQGFKVDS
ncbi:rhodanese-like domain-containing protein [Prosthecochloris sp. SCSIO W1103]|uniref:rhodanese-like domain-containing protein n=1 Tax=Prosthecochloris sp. SCSIO W1103 TaxID=2992244 RepID=UPI00223CF685|nr:rhodanese-like domain-containing protein [Prosthecochloris sp. SCSIO W1103]UZJ38412.1 rhodanese-like domain-containing protein [Prosthecochloris sp. SCSIO W1103]